MDWRRLRWLAANGDTALRGLLPDRQRRAAFLDSGCSASESLFPDTAIVVDNRSGDVGHHDPVVSPLGNGFFFQ